MSRTTKIRRIPQPSYSPDIAPSDFFLFGYLKEKLIEYDIPDQERLKLAITHIFSVIGQETLITFFGTWIERLKWVIKHEGEYFHEKTKKNRNWFNIRRKKARLRTFRPPISKCMANDE
jgi:hypothetical protein